MIEWFAFVMFGLILFLAIGHAWATVFGSFGRELERVNERQRWAAEEARRRQEQAAAEAHRQSMEEGRRAAKRYDRKALDYPCNR